MLPAPRTLALLGLGVLLAIAAHALAPHAPLLAALLVPWPAALAHALASRKNARAARGLDESLPPALFQLAAQPPSTPFSEALAGVARASPPALRAELDWVRRRAERGSDYDAALREAARRSPAPLFSATARLLARAYASGADATRAFRAIAEQAQRLHALRNETAAALALQRYGLVASAALLVPFLLALLLNVTLALSLDAPTGLVPSDTALRNAVAAAVPAYLLVFSALAGAFLALQQRALAHAPAYALALAPASLATHALVQGLTLV